MSGAVAKEVAEALWLTELFDKIDRMNHAIAQHGQILVDVAGDEDADDPDARAGAYWIMQTCHDVIVLRDRFNAHGTVARELVQTVRDARVALDARAEAIRTALTSSWRKGFASGLRTADRWQTWTPEFTDGGGI